VPQKVIYIISDINKALAFEWIANYIDKSKIELIFIILNPNKSYLSNFLHLHNFQVFDVRCRGKKDWVLAIWQTYRLIKKIKPSIVHCHLIQANIIGLIAAKMAGVPKRIYTRHHSSFHHIYFPKGVWWDKVANSLASHIVAISSIVREILINWEKVPSKKVLVIPHGFLLDGFSTVDSHKVEVFREKNKLNNHYPIVGVISRFTELKGIQYIIPAFHQILTIYPNALLLLLNARGDYEQTLLESLKLIPKNNVRLIPFENDIAAAYQAMDVFVHVPIDHHSEAFGQIYVEALVAGVPSIFTRSGIANEPYFNDEVAMIVPHKNVDAIREGIKQVLADPVKREEKIQKGREMAQRFDLSIYIKQLESLYTS